jgi:hypothetical protein
MGKVVVHVLIDVKRSAGHFGFLPKMAKSSRGSIGTFQALSFSGRINSCANLAVTTGNTALDPEEANMLIVLRMNREFMGFMREHYPKCPTSTLR